MAMKLLEMQGLTYARPGSASVEPILDKLDWRLDELGHTLISGVNGSGKSTLLMLAHGKLCPTAGSIVWYGAQGQRETSRIYAQANTALVSPLLQENYQGHAWYITVEEFLIGAQASNAPESASMSHDARQQAEEAQAILAELEAEDLGRLYLPELSQGQWRIALLARCLLRQPGLLLLDEFADSLDAKHGRLIARALCKVSQKCTIVFTSHRAADIPDWCTRHLRLANGRLEESARNTHIAHDRGQKKACSCSLAPKPLANLENVSVFIDRALVLDNINWQIRQGEHWRLSGANGSGKSTLLRLLAGDETAAAGGRVERYDPENGCLLNTLEECRAKISLVSDLGQVNYDYPLNALQLLCSGFDNTIGLYREIGESEKMLAMSWLATMFPDQAIMRLATTSMRKLSTGQLRRLFLARALIRRPALLLLDEALGGLDETGRAIVTGCIASQVAETGMTVIMVSHYDEDQLPFINRFAYLDAGRLQTGQDF